MFKNESTLCRIKLRDLYLFYTLSKINAVILYYEISLCKFISNDQSFQSRETYMCENEGVDTRPVLLPSRKAKQVSTVLSFILTGIY